MTRSLTTRFLDLHDLPALLRLEARQWEPHQQASADLIRERLFRHPGLCIGSFCATRGEALSSLFLRPLVPEALPLLDRWAEAENAPAGTRDDGLFGLSFTSVDPAAADAVFRFFWPHALKGGWRFIALGSPMPGLRRALERDPALDAERYARERRGGLPRDPQLRYYHRKGFTQLVAVRRDYFPHADSLDHAAVIRGRVPLSGLRRLWRQLPLASIARITSRLDDALKPSARRRSVLRAPLGSAP